MAITIPHILILALLLVTLILFIWGRWRFDVIALIALFSSVLLGLVKPIQIFSGFGNPATITVAFILILSFGLYKSGVTRFLSNAIHPVSKWPSLQIGIIIGLGACMSAFMNNVGVLALLMPVAIHSAIRGGYSPSMTLMPLSFGTLLGGMVTMIGTPPNIYMATYRQTLLGTPFGMFDFAPVGLPVSIVGVLFLAFIGWRFLGKRPAPSDQAEDLFQIRNYITELNVTSESNLINKTIAEIEEMTKNLDLIVIGFVPKNRKKGPPEKSGIIQAEDILIVESSPKDTEAFCMQNQLEIGQTESSRSIFNPTQDDWIEVVVSTISELEGQVVEELNLERRYGVKLLAVARQGQPYRGRLKSFRFRVGDVVLLRGDPEALKEFTTSLHLLPLVQRGFELGKQRKPWLATSIFALSIAAITLGLLPFYLSFGLAVLAMVLTGVIPVRQLYDGVDWSIIVLLAALIPIGFAFETTGTAELSVKGFIWLTQGFHPIIILVLLLILTMILTDLINNVAVIVLMAPIAKQIADTLTLNPDTFFMTVTIGASCSFLTPIGHQNNALILGPGKYKFGDYWRIGLPLAIVVICVAVPAILKFWPLKEGY